MQVNSHILDTFTNLSSDKESNTYALTHLWAYALQLTYTLDQGNTTADVYLEASCDNETWVKIPESVITLTGPSGKILYNVRDAAYNYVRLKVESISGSITTATMRVYAKGV